jgi:hypothetical protein
LQNWHSLGVPPSHPTVFTQGALRQLLVSQGQRGHCPIKLPHSWPQETGSLDPLQQVAQQLLMHDSDLPRTGCGFPHPISGAPFADFALRIFFAGKPWPTSLVSANSGRKDEEFFLTNCYLRDLLDMKNQKKNKIDARL